MFKPQPFVHRTNTDGVIDSFCRKCLITVASSQWEAELERAEGTHHCDPIQLEYIQGALDRPHTAGAASPGRRLRLLQHPL